MRSVDEQAFREYAETRTPHLLRAAYLMCGDWHRAQDLVATTMVKLYVAWRRAQRVEHLDAYVNRMLLRVWLDEKRRPWRREHVTEHLPDLVGGGPDAAGVADHAIDVERRDALRRLLDGIPARQRTVLVLRFYQDLSVEQTAEVLGVSPGAVRQLTARALAAVRAAAAVHGGVR
jgi:RNA polymerase sigma-70 factor (sigma-E family)